MGFLDFLSDAADWAAKNAAPLAGGIVGTALGGPVGGAIGAGLGGAIGGVARTGTIGGAVGGALGNLAKQSGPLGGIAGVASRVFAPQLGGPSSAPASRTVLNPAVPQLPAPSPITAGATGGRIYGIPPIPTAIPITLGGVVQNPLGGVVQNPFKARVDYAGPTFSGPRGSLSFSGGGGGRSGGGGASGVIVGNGVSVAQARSALLANASDNAGFRIGWRKLLLLMLRCGLEYTRGVTGLSDSQLLFLYVNRPHRGRRGPYLRTVERRVRQAERYRARVARLARALHVSRGVTHHRPTHALPPPRRRSARR